MTLAQLLQKANEGYPDGFLAEYFDPKTGKRKKGAGDSLAAFVVLELMETFDPGATDFQQLAEAIRVLEKAQRDLQNTIGALQHQTKS